jgi:hypothetical protein
MQLKQSIGMARGAGFGWLYLASGAAVLVARTDMIRHQILRMSNIRFGLLGVMGVGDASIRKIHRAADDL